MEMSQENVLEGVRIKWFERPNIGFNPIILAYLLEATPDDNDNKFFAEFIDNLLLMLKDNQRLNQFAQFVNIGGAPAARIDFPIDGTVKALNDLATRNANDFFEKHNSALREFCMFFSYIRPVLDTLRPAETPSI